MPENNNSSNDEKVEIFGNLKDEDMIRGSKPKDLEKRCLELCQTYIGGSWNQTQSIEDIEVSRITGGLTNQLYRVQLKQSISRIGNSIYPEQEPTDVAIKLYMPKHMQSFHEDDDERLNDIVVLTILSEVGIGPKVYGIFNDGMIQHYHENEQFGLKYQGDSAKVRELAHLLAKVHHLNVPTRKNHDWYKCETIKYLNDAYANHNAQALIDELDLKLLQRLDPRQEYINLFKIVDDLHCPLVFCHNDFRGSNILVTKPSGQLLFVDLEYSAYGARGYDIAGYINEWGYEPMEFDKHSLPDDKVIEMFVRLYVEGCDQLVPGYSSKPENSIEAIVKEVKTLWLVLYLFFVAFMMKATDSLVESVPFDKEQNMKYCEHLYQKYFDMKQRFIKEGTIKN